ncbi:MAG: hypothetical protein HDR88_09995 [Bacteroides sp.]|nr:hypothetical protein [Bacteroides sp.]
MFICRLTASGLAFVKTMGLEPTLYRLPYFLIHSAPPGYGLTPMFATTGTSRSNYLLSVFR